MGGVGWVKTISAQDLFLALHSGITSGELGELYGILGTKQGSVTCKENSLPLIVFL